MTNYQTSGIEVLNISKELKEKCKGLVRSYHQLNELSLETMRISFGLSTTELKELLCAVIDAEVVFRTNLEKMDELREKERQAAIARGEVKDKTFEEFSDDMGMATKNKRVIKRLWEMGCRNTGDVSKLSDIELLQLEGMGQRTLEKVREICPFKPNEEETREYMEFINVMSTFCDLTKTASKRLWKDFGCRTVQQVRELMTNDPWSLRCSMSHLDFNSLEKAFEPAAIKQDVIEKPSTVSKSAVYNLSKVKESKVIEPEGNKQCMLTALEFLFLRKRLIYKLEKAGIKSVEDLLNMSQDEIRIKITLTEYEYIDLFTSLDKFRMNMETDYYYSYAALDKVCTKAIDWFGFMSQPKMTTWSYNKFISFLTKVIGYIVEISEYSDDELIGLLPDQILNACETYREDIAELRRLDDVLSLRYSLEPWVDAV